MKSLPSRQKIKKRNIRSSLPPSGQSSINPKAVAHLKQLLDCVPPARLKKELLYVFLIFLEHEHETLPLNFRQVVTDYFMLFDFLDKAAETASQIN